VNALNTTGRFAIPSNEFSAVGRRQAWQIPQSPLPFGPSGDHQLTFPTGKPPLPPVPLHPEISTHRTASEKREDELSEEWYVIISVLFSLQCFPSEYLL